MACAWVESNLFGCNKGVGDSCFDKALPGFWLMAIYEPAFINCAYNWDWEVDYFISAEDLI